MSAEYIATPMLLNIDETSYKIYVSTPGNKHENT